MNTVQPIRDKAKIEEMKQYLKSNNIRDWALFTLGINSALRISDLLKLDVADVVDENGIVKDRIKVKEKKTGKPKDFPFSKKVIAALTEYIKQTHYKGALFPSQKGGKALGRIQVHRILKDASEKIGIKEPISCHSMRKTFGFQAYEKKVPIQKIQAILNHSSERETLRYIGITQEGLDETYLSMDL